MMSSSAAPREGANPRISRKADAALVAATHPLPAPEHRSTAEQRQAFLEHLYSDYNELHAQQDEIQERKNQMDFDMFESNQLEIHDILFANIEAVNGALGDWDTWEKVEAVMKRYAYGRPRHTAQEREEDAAMRSRIETLSEIVNERNATIQALTQTFKAIQKELGGLLKLMHMKNNEIKTLSNQHHTATLQLRYVQRECAALRGLRSEDDASLLKQDLNYLIEANKKLEAENQLLRGQRQVAQGVVCETQPLATVPQTAPEPRPPPDESSVFEPLQPSLQSAVFDEVLDKCLEDDAFRCEFFQKEVPLCGAVVNAKREAANWKRRLESEVNSAMEMLDYDAATLVIPNALCPSPGLARDVWRSGLSQMQNGVFISYASYDNVPLMRSRQSTVPVLVAPAPSTISLPFSSMSTALAATAKAEATTRTTTSSTAAATTTTVAPTLSSTEEKSSRAVPIKRTVVEAHTNTLSDACKDQQKSTSSSTHLHEPVSTTPLAVKKSTNSSMQAQQRTSTTQTSTASAFASLRTAILRCTELSRANAIRRELLHVAYLRQMLAEEMERASSGALAEVNGADTPQQRALSNTEQEWQQQGKCSTVDGVAAPALVNDESIDSAQAVMELSATSVPQRLRQRVHDNRAPPQDTVTSSAGETDGGEVQSSATFVTLPSSDARRSTLRVVLTSTPTPPLSSRLHGSHARSGGHQAAPGVSLVAAPVVIQSALPLRKRAAALQDEVAALRTSMVTYWSEIQDVFATLRRLFMVHETQLAQAVEDKVMEGAMENAAECVLEAAALQRTAQILKDRFGALLPENAFTPARLPETATDEEWLVHELHTAAAAMIKEAVRPHAFPSPYGTEETLSAVAQHSHSPRPFPTNTPSSQPSQQSVQQKQSPQQSSQQSSQQSPHQSPQQSPQQSSQQSPQQSSQQSPHQSSQQPQQSLQQPQQYAQQDRQHAFPVDRDYFEAEILHPFRLQPPFAHKDASHTGIGVLNGDVRWDTGETDDEWSVLGAAVNTQGAKTEGRSAGGVDGRFTTRPTPPTQWYWRTRNAQDVTAPSRSAAAGEPRPAMPARHFATITAASLISAASRLQSSPADLQSLKPTVLRYVFDGTKLARERAVSAHIQSKTAFLYGAAFEDFVRRYIVPIISAAGHISANGTINAAMRAAVQDLRQKERMRRKRGVRLLFDRVANNIRTRNLLKRNVYQGEAFVSYVGLLYRKWRTKLECHQRRVQSDQETNRKALFSLLQLRNFASTTDTFTKATSPLPSSLPKSKPRAGSSKRMVDWTLAKSSYHFDKVKFDAQS